jgi:hypothetical protein
MRLFPLVLACSLAGLAGLTGSGCRADPDPDRWLAAAALPLVAVDGTPRHLQPGCGVELSGGRLVPAEVPVPLGWRAHLAWSRHAVSASAGADQADYFRLGLGPTLRLVRPLGEQERNCLALLVTLGGEIHYVRVDGAGDIGGGGLTLAPEVRFIFRDRFSLALGATLGGWVDTSGGFSATLTATAGLGVSF